MHNIDNKFLLLGDDKEGGTGKGFVITFADEAPAKSKPQVIKVKLVQTKVVPVLYFDFYVPLPYIAYLKYSCPFFQISPISRERDIIFL